MVWKLHQANKYTDEKGFTKQKADISVTVGTTGDYSTINEAIEYLVENYYAVYKKSGFAAEIILEEAFEMQEQVLVNGIDLGWITIVSEASAEQIDINNIVQGSGVSGEEPTAETSDVEVESFDYEINDVQTTLIDTTGDAIGDGETNTAAIIAQDGHRDSAALVCGLLDIDGTDDWFLPSGDELDAMYDNLHDIVSPLGGFTSLTYWTSSEYSATEARRLRFSDRKKDWLVKTSTYRVRPVRSFIAADDAYNVADTGTVSVTYGANTYTSYIFHKDTEAGEVGEAEYFECAPYGWHGTEAGDPSKVWTTSAGTSLGLNGVHFELEDASLDRYYFWFEVTGAAYEEGTDPAPIDPEAEGATGVKISVEDDTEPSTDDIAELIETAINNAGFDVTATRTGSVVTATNDNDGKVDSGLTSNNDRIRLEVTQEGFDGLYYARFEIGSQTIAVDDLIIIRDQEGTIEEEDYNGLWEVIATDTGWVETVQIYDANKVTASHGFILDATPIKIDGDWLKTTGETWEFFYKPSFGVARGTLPLIGCIFEVEFDAQEADFGEYLDGFCATDQGKMNFLPYTGVIGAGGSGIYGTRNSLINANDAIASECGRHGFWAYSGTIINARRALALGNGVVAKREGIARIDTEVAFTDEISGAGIIATRGSIINADEATATGNYSDNIHSEHGALISAPGVEVFDSTAGLDVAQRYGGMVSCSLDDTDGLHTNDLFIKGQKLPEGKPRVTLENLVKNGDFNQGADGWSLTNGTITTNDFKYGNASLLAKVLTNNTSSNISDKIPCSVGDKIYVFAYGKIISGNSTAQGLYVNGWSTASRIDLLHTKSVGVWHKLSGIYEATGTDFDIRLGQFTSNVIFEIGYDGVGAVNLTEENLEHLTKNELDDLIEDYFNTKQISLPTNENKALSVVDGNHGYHTIGEIDPSKLTSDLHISVWDTRNTTEGSSDSSTIKLPLEGAQDCRILWGDGTPIQKITDGAEAEHEYEEEGIYEIKIIGEVNGFAFDNSGDEEKLLEIKAWGKEFGLGDNAFYGCKNLRVSATDLLPMDGVTSYEGWFRGTTLDKLLNFELLDMSDVTSIRDMFRESNFNYSIGNWNTGNIENMRSMFNSSQFNQPIGDWDTSNVTTMQFMFYNSPFNQPIGDWDTSNVTTMRYMFYNSPFNQPIGDWNTSNVTDMQFMFHSSPFNQPIGDWDTSSVTNMQFMFYSSQFNQPIGDWNTSRVTTMHSMFYDSPFNQPINNWDTSNVTNMHAMFRNSPFNQPINNWDTSSVTSMYAMFHSSPFNKPIGDWDTSSVTNMSHMFYNSPFNQPIGDWDTSNVTNMHAMFLNSPFNQPIGDWDTSNVTSMHRMFHNTPFNQDISTHLVNEGEENEYTAWDVSSVTDFSHILRDTPFDYSLETWDISSMEEAVQMLDGSNFSDENYKPTIKEWARQGGWDETNPSKNNAINEDVEIHFGSARLVGDAESARAFLVNEYGWVITDGDT